MDRRRLDDEHAPFLRSVLDDYPSLGLRSLPSSELATTIFTGTYPGTHGYWHVRLRPDAPRPTPWWLRHVPDVVSTSFQGLLRAARISRGDAATLATVPYRRLRHLQLTRYKYGRKGRRPRDLLTVGKIPTLFAAIGLRERGARYTFHRDVARTSTLAPDLGRGGYAVDFLESRALDIIQHWSLDRSDVVRAAYRAMDTRMAELRATCTETGARLLVFSDHGHAAVEHSIDLRPILRAAGLPPARMTHFVEPSLARFWAHDESARDTLRRALSRVPDTMLLTHADLPRYDLEFETDAYGQLFLSPRPGRVFFPHDFHQPIANLFLALADRTMRHRLRNPRLRGDHAYLPEYPSERGFVVLVDGDGETVDGEATLIDIAPTILTLAGYRVPAHMTGRILFRPGR
jgi:hypothetical protein